MSNSNRARGRQRPPSKPSPAPSVGGSAVPRTPNAPGTTAKGISGRAVGGPVDPPATDPLETPFSVEMGPAGAPLGVGTSADYEAELEPDSARARQQRAAASGAASARAGAGRGIGARRRPAARRATPAHPPLLQDEGFRTFWLTRLTTQTAQGAMLYAFFIIVADRTDAASFNALFVVCSSIPSILFGLPGGIVVDAVPRRPLLVWLNLARFVFAFALVTREPSLPGIFAATIGLWTIHQFHAPSESAALAQLVPPERYTAAQALSNLALTLAQLAGLVILAPLLLKTAGPQTLFAVCAALFIVAAGFAALLPRLDEHVGREGAWSGGRRAARRSLRAALLDGWRGVRADHVTYQALVSDVLVGIGMSALVVIMPLYLKRVLGTAAENTVFVFAPAAIGLVLGLRFAPRLGHAVGEQRAATAGLIGFAACVGALGFAAPLRTFLDDGLRLPLDQAAELASIPPLVVIAMLLSIPAGFTSALVSVSSRSLLLARTPAAQRGQVIATQSLLAHVGALAPTLLAGVATDIFGVEPIAVAIAVAITGGAVAARIVGRRPIPVPAGSPS